jgi:hypothetical protein
MNLTKLEKQLIAMSHLGIRIEIADGHRWIRSEETDDFYFHQELEKAGVLLNNKMYGGLVEAIQVIDRCMCLLRRPLLEDYFNSVFDKDDVYSTSSDNGSSRIDIGDMGDGGLC